MLRERDGGFMQDFRNLAVYRDTAPFPKEEIYGLTCQFRRAAVSVGANIAEGCGRESDADFNRFLGIAFGSVNEIHYYVILARDLHFLEPSRFATLEDRVLELKRMLLAFMDKLQSSPAS